jgi:pyruvate/2-oxoglutarate dehydrogenase complex dihydrolipoamide dehydrogenase (E3) component
MAFVGVQPVFTQVPPRTFRSTSATGWPALASLAARKGPACPEPMMIESKVLLIHTAYNDFEIVAANLLEGGNRRVTDRIPARATYTDPPLARVGLTEEEARATGRDLLIATRPMAWVSRAIEKGETFCLMKAIVDAQTKRIMGAMIFGVGGDEAIHSTLDIMYADKLYTTITNAVHIHPTVAELIPTLLGSLQPANPQQEK